MEDTDCLVIGAGVSGLTAAHELKKRGVDVRVLEARERVGGRTWSGVLDGAEVDWGGEWIGHGQPRVYALIKELGLRTFATYDQGRKVLEVSGRISTYTGTIPWMAPWKLIQIQAGIWRLDGLARGLAKDASWTHPRAGEWDATTLDAARRSVMWSADARGVMDAAMRTIFGAESGELSLLHALAYIRSAGSLNNLIAPKAASSTSASTAARRPSAPPSARPSATTACTSVDPSRASPTTPPAWSCATPSATSGAPAAWWSPCPSRWAPASSSSPRCRRCARSSWSARTWAPR